MSGIYRTLKRVEELESPITFVSGGKDHIVDRFLLSALMKSHAIGII
jgi:hypothetical protein